MQKIRSIDTLNVESSMLCCNFVNTVYAWRGVNLHDYLGSYVDVIAWCKKLKVYDEPYLIALRAGALARVRLSYGNDRFFSGFPELPVDLESPCWPALKSFYEVISQMDLRRLKECPKCGWVFYDETKNGRKRWCSPTECGTQDKMMRYNKKKKMNLSTE